MATVTPSSPRPTCYPKPPDARLHYAVAEYDGKVPIPPSDAFPGTQLPEGCTAWQSGLGFRIVSKPTTHDLAADELKYLIARRLNATADNPVSLHGGGEK